MTQTLVQPTVGPEFSSLLSVADGYARVTLAGEGDITSVDVLETTLSAAVTAPTGADVLVDVADLTFMGAAVVDCLAAADQRLRAQGRRLYVVNANRRVARLLDLLDLQELIASHR